MLLRLSAISLALFSMSVEAALVAQSISNVEILGVTYDVTLWQDDDGYTGFDQVYGVSTMTSDLTFTGYNDAYAAAQVLTDYALANQIDLSPFSSFNAAVVAYGATPDGYDYVVAYPSCCTSPTGPWEDYTRAGEYSVGSYAQFTISQVPVPATAWLFGSALMGLHWLRRKPIY